MADENTTETTNSTETPSLSPEATSGQPEAGSPFSTTTLLTADPAAEPAAEPKVEEPAVEQTDDEKAAAEAKAVETAALFGAPEGDAAYEIALPEGVTLDKAALDAVTPLARDLNLSNAGMQKLAETYMTAVQPAVVKQVLDGVNADVAATQKAWSDAAVLAVTGGTDADGAKIAPDKAFEGKAMKEVQQVAAKAIDRFGGADFRAFCEETGMGNNPALLKFAYLAGSLISEDTGLERGGGQPVTPLTREQKYYNRSTT